MPRGVYDRSGRAKSDGAAQDTIAGKLDALKALARKADRMEAKAKKLRKDADTAAWAAGEARDEFTAKMKELSV